MRLFGKHREFTRFAPFFRSGLSNRIGETRDSRRSQPVSKLDYHIFNLSKRPKNPEKTASRPFSMFNQPTNSGEEA